MAPESLSVGFFQQLFMKQKSSLTLTITNQNYNKASRRKKVKYIFEEQKVFVVGQTLSRPRILTLFMFVSIISGQAGEF